MTCRRAACCSRWWCRSLPEHAASRRAVGEGEGALSGLLYRDHEAHPIRPATRKRRAGVFVGDRIHVPAPLIGPNLDDPALDRGHPVGVVDIGYGQGDTRIAKHVLCLPDRIGRAHEDLLALEAYPHDPIPWRAVGAERREV